MPNRKLTLAAVVWSLMTPAGLLAQASADLSTDHPWKRHVIDSSSRGADGVKLSHVNGDERLDITTGWEEGGVTRVYLHPGYGRAKTAWPAVTVGKAPSVEDAVFCDLDGDGAIDVISSCEGGTRSMFVHWAPKASSRYLHPEAWVTEAIPATVEQTAWMYALPMQIDGRNGVDLAVASKGKNGLVGWLQSPANPRALVDWRLHRLYRAGWIMTLASVDVDGDGDLDLLVSDRKGGNSGILWLENPGTDAVAGNWPEHRIGAAGREVMFLDAADLDGDGHRDIIAAVKPDEIHWFRPPSVPSDPWPVQVIKVAHRAGIGSAKAVRVGDIDGNGKADIVYSCESATPPKRGVVWLSYDKTPHEKDWHVNDISGPEGIKFDLIELFDIDGDGDLDVLTCEERHQGKGIGVFWYENPLGERE